MKAQLLALLLFAPLHAQAITQSCATSPSTNKISITLSNLTSKAGTIAHPIADVEMWFSDRFYPQNDYVYVTHTIHYGDEWRSSTRMTEIPPQGLHVGHHIDLFSTHPLEAGDHPVAYQIYIPLLGCDVTARGILKVT